MDEPTNHVDAATRHAIAKALGRFGGIALLVSHDRELLDALCTQCLFVSRGLATMRPGSYTQGSAQAELERGSAVRARAMAHREKERLEREAQRRREEASRAASRRSGRGAAKNDSDAREKRARFIVSGQDGRAGRLSSRMEARLDDAAGRLDAARVEKRYGANVWLDATPSRRKVLLRMGETAIPLGGGAALAVPALRIGSADHIGLVGDNGSGKTTLARRVVESLPAATRALYVPQEPTRRQRQSAVDALAGLASADRGRVLSIVARLNSEPERILEGGDVSPGEMRKLMLALGILDAPELIVMDEPTNHLDLESIEALERLLAALPGALLLVSHDAALVRATTNVTWAMGEASGGYRLMVG